MTQDPNPRAGCGGAAPPHPADRLAALLAGAEPGADPGLAEALAALLAADREARVGSRHHAIVRRMPGGDRVTVAPLPDLAGALALLEGTVAVVDTETTGLHPHCGHRLASVAVLRGAIRDGAFAEAGAPYHAVVNPGRASTPEARAVHRLDPGDLARRPPFAAIAAGLARVLGGQVLVAHNAPFDLDFLDQEFARTALAGPTATARATLDTRVLAKMLWPGEPGGLDALADRVGIDRGGRDLGHDALGDARLLAACLPGLAAAIRTRPGFAARIAPAP